jgi:hypothetical protein
MLSFFSKHWKSIAAGVVGLFVLTAVITLSVNWFQSRHVDKNTEKYEADSKAWATEKSKLLGQIAERDKQIAELEIQKQVFKTAAEQGVKMDAEKAKQIDAISAKEATDLEGIRKDMDCVTRARDTVALLLTAKPPIRLDLAATIRKQCPSG